jgi:aspartate-semialdehyde dehydrogenase
VYLLQYAFNIFSHNAPVLENGYNEEEMKMVKETRKIWVSETIPDRSANWSEYYPRKPALLSIEL